MDLILLVSFGLLVEVASIYGPNSSPDGGTGGNGPEQLFAGGNVEECYWCSISRMPEMQMPVGGGDMLPVHQLTASWR